MPRTNDYTGQIVAGKVILGRAEDGYAKSPKWRWRCLNCGHEGKPASWYNLRGLERKNSKYCNNCRGDAQILPIGTRSGNLVVTGPCRKAGRNPSGISKREVPARCTLCGYEDWWDKGNFSQGVSNCKCQQHCQQGRSNTREGILWARAKKRAKDQGVPFTIKHEDIVIPSHCPVLGIKLEHADRSQQSRKGMGGFHDASPTLDKFIPELGYVPTNVAVISWRANRTKGDATLEELEKLVDWMRKQQ